jgi:hypothetical protein
MKEFFEIFYIFLTSGLKFLLGPTQAVAMGFKAWESILITSGGGITGVIVFYFSSKWIIKKLFNYKKKKREFKIKEGNWNPPKKFTYMNKLIIKVKNRFGLTGLAIITPGILSIPFGTLLAVRYFSKNENTLKTLIFSVIGWSVFLTYLSKLVQINLK